MAEGWIKLHRKIKGCYFWPELERRKFTHMEAWIDLLLTANHRPNEVMVDLQKVNVERGQLLTSEVKLSTRWKWSRNKVRRFINVLENEKMLIKKSTTKYTLLTIDKYDFYQGDDTADGTTKRHQTEQQKNIKRNTNKNVKNVKNVKKKDIYTEFVKMTPEEHQKLIEKFGEEKTKDWIERLNLYKGSTGKKYNSDYLTILNWSNKEEKQNKSRPPNKEQSQPNQAKKDKIKLLYYNL